MKSISDESYGASLQEGNIQMGSGWQDIDVYYDSGRLPVAIYGLTLNPAG